MNFRLIPFMFMLLLCLALGFGLFNHDRPASSRMIGQTPSDFTLPLLGSNQSTSFPSALIGKVTVVNVFASWCESCQVEHTVLMEASKNMHLIGIAWRDKPEKITAWLSEHGNPYRSVAVDTRGTATMPLGLSGVPETFVFNKKGMIVYNSKSPLTNDEVNNVILPLVEGLSHAQ